MIKILHIIKSLGRGGAEMLLPETHKVHDISKFEFHYIYFLPWTNDLERTINELGGKVTCLPADNNIDIFRQYKNVVKYIDDHEIDLVHCHLPWSGFLGRLVFKNLKLPVIYTEHNIQEKYHILTKLVNKYTYNFQSIAIGVSADVTRSIKENIAPKIPVTTVLNGVNIEHFKRNVSRGAAIKEELGIPADAPVVGNIAVFRKQKCIPGWIKAFAVASTNNDNLFGIVVGSGPEEESAKKLISELGLSNKVFLPGLQEDTLSYFSAMDIFMLSSDFEGLPVALLEAMSVGCAVVSTKAGGVVEAVRDGQEGLLAEVGDWEGLGERLVELLENREKRSKMQEVARKRIVDSFSLSTMVDELEQIYLKTFEHHSRSQVES